MYYIGGTRRAWLHSDKNESVAHEWTSLQFWSFRLFSLFLYLAFLKLTDTNLNVRIPNRDYLWSRDIAVL